LCDSARHELFVDGLRHELSPVLVDIRGFFVVRDLARDPSDRVFNGTDRLGGSEHIEQPHVVGSACGNDGERERLGWQRRRLDGICRRASVCERD
jgi:hypothetical protein